MLILLSVSTKSSIKMESEGLSNCEIPGEKESRLWHGVIRMEDGTMCRPKRKRE